VDVFNRLEAAQRVGEPLNLMREGYPLVYGIVARSSSWRPCWRDADWPYPHVVKLGLMTATVIGLAGVSETRADDAAVVAEIVAGIRERERSSKICTCDCPPKSSHRCLLRNECQASRRRNESSAQNLDWPAVAA